MMFAIAVVSSTAGGERYGDRLLATEFGRHPELRCAAIDLDPPSKAHFQVGTRRASRHAVALELADGVGERIGTLTLGFRQQPEKHEGAKIATEISRHVYTAALFAEPDPFVADASTSRLGHALVERELKGDPNLVTVALHVALPAQPNEIIASNFGRIGKAADADDRHVVADSAILQEETNAGRRLAVELPLLDRKNRVIGALSTSFLIGPGGREAAYRSALRVQKQLSRSIPRMEKLAR